MKRPMLAAAVEELSQLRYPLCATPKLDGIRCIIRGGVPHTRSFKLVPNLHIRSVLQGLPNGLDGELIAGDYNATQSAVMRSLGTPEFQYVVFDRYSTLDYWSRVHFIPEDPRYTVLKPTVVYDEAALLAFESDCLAVGYEGIMLRDAHGPYYEGRASLQSHYLLKFKRFVDAEAKVVSYKEGTTNTNAPELDAFGYQKRSGHSSGKLNTDTLGSLVCVDCETGQEVQIGSGFTDALRDELWARRQTLIGTTVKYRYQRAIGCAPRFPRFIGFRLD